MLKGQPRAGPSRDGVRWRIEVVNRTVIGPTIKMSTHPKGTRWETDRPKEVVCSAPYSQSPVARHPGAMGVGAVAVLSSKPYVPENAPAPIEM